MLIFFSDEQSEHCFNAEWTFCAFFMNPHKYEMAVFGYLVWNKLLLLISQENFYRLSENWYCSIFCIFRSWFSFQRSIFRIFSDVAQLLIVNTFVSFEIELELYQTNIIWQMASTQNQKSIKDALIYFYRRHTCFSTICSMHVHRT